MTDHDDLVPPEPFPWMSTNRPTGRYRMTLTSPISEAALGSFLIVAGAVFVTMLLQDPSGATIAVAALLVLMFGGLGVLLLVMAVRRRRWAQAYKRANGYLPY